MINSSPDPQEEAATALIAAAHSVEPTGDDLGLWRVDGRLLTDGDLVALALRLGLMDGSGELQ